MHPDQEKESTAEEMEEQDQKASSSEDDSDTSFISEDGDSSGKEILLLEQCFSTFVSQIIILCVNSSNVGLCLKVTLSNGP